MKYSRRKWSRLLLAVMCAGIAIYALALTSHARVEPSKSDFKEVYTGTIVSMQGRAVSTGFTLSIRDFTPDDEVMRYLTILAEGDQDDVLKVLRNVDRGSISPTGQTRRVITVARKAVLPDGRTRIVVAFERWLRFAEVRNGYRSEDYPFGIMEFFVDAKGKGSGTFIAACQIDMKKDKKTGKYQLELENFGTYPHRVMGVMLREKND